MNYQNSQQKEKNINLLILSQIYNLKLKPIRLNYNISNKPNKKTL